MKLLLIIAVILLPNISIGQDLKKQKAIIDTEVERITKGKLATVNFSIQALKKVLHYISYKYIETSKGYILISRQFSHKNDTIQQTFYLRDGSLIYATENITSYFSENGKTDSIFWQGAFYFSKGKLIDHISLGHGKSEIDTWNPEQEMLTAFSESKRDVARYKNGG